MTPCGIVYHPGPVNTLQVPMKTCSNTAQTVLDTAHLTERACQGDREGLRQLHEHLAPALYSWVRLRLLEHPFVNFDPSDIVQEVWLRVLAHIARYESSRASFRGWVFGIAGNVTAEWLRQSNRQRAHAPSIDLDRLATEEVGFTCRITREMEASELCGKLWAWADQDATPLDRQLLLYRGLQGLPHAKVAHLVGREEQTIRNRWSMLRRRLTHVLGSGPLE